MMPPHALNEYLVAAGIPVLLLLVYVAVPAVLGFFVIYQAVYRGVRRALREAGGVRPGMSSQPPLGP